MNEYSRPVILSEDDADRRAIDDLTRQAKAQSGPMAVLTRARRDQLKAEVAAELDFARALRRARLELLETLEVALQASSPLTVAQMTDEQLLELILRGGLGLAIADFDDQQDKIREAAERALVAVQPDFGFASISSQIDQIQSAAAAGVFEDVILPDFKAAIRAAISDVYLDVPVDVAMSTLNDRLNRSEGKQLTEVKTKISQYGRSITAAAASAADLDYYLYTGPQDGITRPFCQALVGLVVSSKQMSRLNNGQGLNVLTSCGGYNCRHSWSPVTEGFVEAADLPKAKPADISEANRGARRR